MEVTAHGTEVRPGESVFRLMLAHSNAARIFKLLIVLDFLSFPELDLPGCSFESVFLVL